MLHVMCLADTRWVTFSHKTRIQMQNDVLLLTRSTVALVPPASCPAEFWRGRLSIP